MRKGGLPQSRWDSCHQWRSRKARGFLSPADHLVGPPDQGSWDLGWPVLEGWQGQVR